MLQPKKKLQKDIRFQELAEELAKSENAKLVIRIFQSTMTTQFAASA
jgi:hypothetical protein